MSIQNVVLKLISSPIYKLISVKILKYSRELIYSWSSSSSSSSISISLSDSHNPSEHIEMDSRDSLEPLLADLKDISLQKANLKDGLRSFYLILCKLEDSFMVGRVARSLSVGRRCLRVRWDNFQTNLWRCATLDSRLYLSNWLVTTSKQLAKLPAEI